VKGSFRPHLAIGYATTLVQKDLHLDTADGQAPTRPMYGLFVIDSQDAARFFARFFTLFVRKCLPTFSLRLSLILLAFMLVFPPLTISQNQRSLAERAGQW